MNPTREYREHLYRLRQHPASPEDTAAFRDDRDNFKKVYFSLGPFLVLEWALRDSWSVYPHGVVFPVGFLLFWAFYYTYYKPGLLEDRLAERSQWTTGRILVVLAGVTIWFVKATVVELGQLLMLLPRVATYRRFGGLSEAGEPEGARTPPPLPNGNGARATSGAPTEAHHLTRVFVLDRDRRPVAVALPRDVLYALTVLGLDVRSSWDDIHKRYRELAKKYHPDLAKDQTLAGRRFMQVDAAYRRLLEVREKFFRAGDEPGSRVG
jgi:hypothetical protein